jgi:hypothetical protein
MATITSPVEGFTGTATFGPVTLAFMDGTATAGELPDGVVSYLALAGYTVDDGKPAAPKRGRPPKAKVDTEAE